MKKLLCAALVLGAICSSAMGQSAGSLITSVGGAWLDFGPSSATSLQSSSALGTFTSAGTGGQIHNTFTLELSTTYFITDHIAFDLAAGIPPKLKLYAQGNATPFGAGGPSLALGNLQPLATTRSWAPILFLKYYFFDAQTKLRPFIGVGANYTWYSHTDLNSTFNGALQQIAGPGGRVTASLSPSWNPAFDVGASYNISKNWYATASVTYLFLKTNATVNSVAANGQTVLSNKTRITADPVIVFLGLGYRF
ncbi:OmpW family protein [Paraburkholderia fungorum]|uniref:OmpW family protein n=1 Tax=Paraburkholderia fungorum TaxID=134537 RepID=A0A420FSA9_9BURK|nr:OmpW family outer membrane protein [Paraburkholderia fungorum]RKF35876.1 OmpW family protein [Paraburkholderia fungorum]